MEFLGTGRGYDQRGGAGEQRLTGQHDDHRHLGADQPVKSGDGCDTGYPDYQLAADHYCPVIALCNDRNLL
jgi:hypothetical protein